jgi:hypothetical protein
MADAEKLVDKLAHKAGVVQRVMQTQDGREMLEILEGEFLSNLAAKEEHLVVFNAGRADVVAYIKQLMRFKPQGR